jgi:hypothetical protein
MSSDSNPLIQQPAFGALPSITSEAAARARRCGFDRRRRIRVTTGTPLPSATNTTWSLTIEGLTAFPSDETLLSARGKYTSIDVPLTDLLVIRTLPPDCLATPSTMLRPRPDPLTISLVVKRLERLPAHFVAHAGPGVAHR